MNEPERAEGAKPKAGDKMGAEPGDGGMGGSREERSILGNKVVWILGGKNKPKDVKSFRCQHQLSTQSYPYY